MKALKIIGIGITSIIALFLIVAIFLPSNFHVERSINIKSNKAKVYKAALNYDLRPQWDPWLSQDPAAEVKIEKTEDGPGSWYSWNGEIIGSGKIMIKSIVLNKKILAKLEFYEPQQSKSDVIWTFTEKEGNTKAIWAIEGTADYPIGRYLGIMMDSFIGSDFEKGLNKFKTLVEKLPDFISSSSDITEVKVENCNVLFLKSDVNTKNIAQVMKINYNKIMSLIGEDLQLMGYPRCIYNEWDKETGDMKIECAIPIQKKILPANGIKYKEIAGGKTLMLTHYGPYSSIKQSYEKMLNYMKEKDIQSNGAPWEEYLTNPQKEPDQSKWETRIYFPI